MATITAAMVKDLRETTGVGMMDCKQALTENDGDMEAAIDWLRKKGLSKAAKKAGRVAAEGLIGALTDGHQGRRGRGQFRDRLRRAQRAVPGPGQDDRPGRAQGRRRRREDQGRPGRRRHGRDRDLGCDRHHRREHDAAPRRFARSRPGRGVELRPQRRDRRRRQDGRDRRAGIRRQDRRTRRARPPARDACRRRQPAGAGSGRARSRGRDARKGRAGRQVPSAGQAGER